MAEPKPTTEEVLKPRELTQQETRDINAGPVPNDFITTGFTVVNGQRVRLGYTPLMRLLNPHLFGDEDGLKQ